MSDATYILHFGIVGLPHWSIGSTTQPTWSHLRGNGQSLSQCATVRCLRRKVCRHRHFTLLYNHTQSNTRQKTDIGNHFDIDENKIRSTRARFAMIHDLPMWDRSSVPSWKLPPSSLLAACNWLMGPCNICKTSQPQRATAVLYCLVI